MSHKANRFDYVEFVDRIRDVLGLEPIPHASCARAIEQSYLAHHPNLPVLRAQLETCQASQELFESRATKDKVVR